MNGYDENCRLGLNEIFHQYLGKNRNATHARNAALLFLTAIINILIYFLTVATYKDQDCRPKLVISKTVRNIIKYISKPIHK